MLVPYEDKFQFQNGAVKSIALQNNISVPSLFQFQNGAVKSKSLEYHYK